MKIDDALLISLLYIQISTTRAAGLWAYCNYTNGHFICQAMEEWQSSKTKRTMNFLVNPASCSSISEVKSAPSIPRSYSYIVSRVEMQHFWRIELEQGSNLEKKSIRWDSLTTQPCLPAPKNANSSPTWPEQYLLQKHDAKQKKAYNFWTRIFLKLC